MGWTMTDADGREIIRDGEALLTLDDLERALADERHLGWGYAGRNYLSASARERLDRNVVAVANELGLDYEDLFAWTNSKYGRWLTDDASSSSRRRSRAAVRGHLNAKAIETLRKEEGR